MSIVTMVCIAFMYIGKILLLNLERHYILRKNLNHIFEMYANTSLYKVTVSRSDQ